MHWRTFYRLSDMHDALVTQKRTHEQIEAAVNFVPYKLRLPILDDFRTLETILERRFLCRSGTTYRSQFEIPSMINR